MKIAIIRLSALGDIFHMLYLMPIIRANYKDAKIDFFVDSRFFNAVENLVWFDSVISLPAKKSPLKAYKILKNYHKKYDISIDFQGRIKSAFIANYVGKKSFGYSKIGLREKSARFFYTDFCECAYLENVYKRSYELAKTALKISSDKSDEMALKYYAEVPCEKENFILLHNGSSKVKKMYPLENLIEICKNSPFSFKLAWGNELEFKRASEIAKQCKNATVLEKMSLRELIAFSKKASLIIGNDTGPVHLATLIQTPSITFLNESEKKPAARLIKNDKKHFYFHKFSEASPKAVREVIEKLLEKQ